MMKFHKFAFQATAEAERVVQFAQQRRCKEVFIVGDNPKLAQEVRAAGLTVHLVKSKEELGADVFPYLEYDGTWASVETATGWVVATVYAEDSWMAAASLLSNYAPGYREQFHVQPAKVELLDVF